MDKVIEEYPDETCPIEMGGGVNNEDDDKKEITADNEYEGVIHRNFTDNEKENIQDILDKVKEEFPDDTHPVDMEEGVNENIDIENEKMMREKIK